jgi:glycerol-1-phosphate dehydrogenase [NAD(P)+]
MSASPFAPPSLADALHKARQTRQVCLQSGALGQTPHLFGGQFGGGSAVVVADPVTWNVAGRAVAAALGAAGVPLLPPHLFPADGFYAEIQFVEQLEASLRRHHAIPIAVGSGTINDIVKLAAHRVGRPYLCVATAASMDGYTAFGASITFKGSKQTFSCPAPVVVVADLDVIVQAPAAMTASGYADLLAKITAGADWLVADALEVERLDRDAWLIVQSGLRDAVSDPAAVARGAPRAIRRLMEGLLMGGFAMQWIQSSRAASGAEHQFSHLWDMQHHTHNGVTPSHGFKVGIATIASAALYEHLLMQPVPRLDFSSVCAHWADMSQLEPEIRNIFSDTEIAAKAIEETSAKYPSRAVLVQRLALLRRIWPDLSRRLGEQLMPANTLREMLTAAGAPGEPTQIGISHERLHRSFRESYYMRRRYTVLDLAMESGLLDCSLRHLFQPGGRWPITAQPGNATPPHGEKRATAVAS